MRRLIEFRTSSAGDGSVRVQRGRRPGEQDDRVIAARRAVDLAKREHAAARDTLKWLECDPKPEDAWALIGTRIRLAHAALVLNQAHAWLDIETERARQEVES